MELLTKLLICAGGAAEYHVNEVSSFDFSPESQKRKWQSWENLRAAVRDVEAQRNFLKQQGQMAA